MIDVKLSPPISFITKQAGAFRHALDDLHPLWEMFDETMDEIMADQFSSHGHGEWAPLAASTVARKGSSEILVDTGTLEGSFDALSMGAHKFSYGTDVEYAHWHQEGGYVEGRPPQRKLLDIRVEDRRKLEQQTVKYVDAAARRTFGSI